MDERPEEILFTDFSKGYDPRQWPPNFVRERVVPDRMLHHEHLAVEYDGTLRWHRNQFYVYGPEEKVPEVLFEFANDDKNQMLYIDDAGDLYVMDTNWKIQVPVQGQYGYELFNGGVWNLKDSSGEVSPWALAMSREVLFVGHKNLATKRWNGTDLVDIGLVPPQGASPFGDDQDLTTYVEHDPGLHLTIVATRATATNIPRTSDSCVYYDFGVDYLAVRKHCFDIRITSAQDGGRVLVWGVTDAIDHGIEAWDNGWGIAVGRTGSDYQLIVVVAQNAASLGEVGFYNDLELNTTYYVAVRKYGGYFWTEIYSDEDRTDRIWAFSISLPDEDFRYLHAMAGYEEAAGAQTINAYSENLTVSEVVLDTGKLPAGIYTYVCTFGNDEYESMRSRTLDVEIEGDDDTIELINIPIGPLGVTWRKIYRAYGASGRGPTYQYLAKIDDNTTTTYIDNMPQSYLGDEMPFDYARPPRGDLLTFFKERMFMAGVSRTSDSYPVVETTGLQNLLFYSELGHPDYWPRANWIEIGDSAPIVAIAAFGDQLLVFKTNMVYSVTTYGTSFSIRQLDTQFGATDPCSVASSPQGVAWTSPQGLVFYDGQSLKLILEAKSDWAIDMPEGERPWLAYHQGYVYFQACHLLRWDTLRDVWEMYPHPQSGALTGIRAFNHGKYQSHLLLVALWADEGVPNYITILDPVEAFPNGNGEGLFFEKMYSRIQLTLPPIIARPGEEIWIQEIWIDGSWAQIGLAIREVKLYVNTNADYSTGELGDAPQGNRGILLNPDGHIGIRQYIQLAGEYAKDFELRAVRVVVSRRGRRVQAYP